MIQYDYCDLYDSFYDRICKLFIDDNIDIIIGNVLTSILNRHSIYNSTMKIFCNMIEKSLFSYKTRHIDYTLRDIYQYTIATLAEYVNVPFYPSSNVFNDKKRKVVMKRNKKLHKYYLELV